MRVFISHSSKDKPAVEVLVEALREAGIEPWFDTWEIGPGDDIVAKINAGLDEADGGVVVFSESSRESRWVEAETSYLTYARIQEGKVLVPVVLGDDAYVPPLLRPLARRRIDELDAIVGALRSRTAGPRPVQARPGRVEKVSILLERVEGDGGGIRSTVRIGDEVYGGETHKALSPKLVEARGGFLRGPSLGTRRNALMLTGRSLDEELVILGDELRALCLPGDGEAALFDLVTGTPVGVTVEVCFRARDRELVGLPFEALRLSDGRLLATEPGVVVFRSVEGIAVRGERPAPPAGPLKILVAVGAPDEELVDSPVLDQERELQNILDALEPARRDDNAQMRVLNGSFRTFWTPWSRRGGTTMPRCAFWRWGIRT